MKINQVMHAAGLATLMLVAGSGVAFAANATMNRDADVFSKASSSASVINEVYEDDDVSVTKCTKNFCFLKNIDGPDGWVRKKAVDFWDDEEDVVPPPKKPGVSVCLGNPVGGICIQGN